MNRIFNLVMDTVCKTCRRNALVPLAMAVIPMVVIVSIAFIPGGGKSKRAASLKTVPVPEPVNLGSFLKSDPGKLNAMGFPVPSPEAKAAAIQLGKALFWDMQVGSDGLTACASCHFHAGADSRVRNQMSPGLLSEGDPDGDGTAGDQTFEVAGPNEAVTQAGFPFHQRIGPIDVRDRQRSDIARNTNDVMASMGVFFSEFVDVEIGSPFDLADPLPDPVFNTGNRPSPARSPEPGERTRRVEPRNAPTVINSVFYFSSFWDGRARNIFNGMNPFGELDHGSRLFVDTSGGLSQELVRIPDASLASQAVGPPTSDFEMSARGRTFAKIGKKMLSLKPLAFQEVAPDDSVLGAIRDPGSRGLATSYKALIQAAFQDKYWANSAQKITFTVVDEYWHAPSREDPRGFYTANGIPSISEGQPAPGDTTEFTQMEANFSLFFGLAIQLYEATLVADDSKYDRVQEGLATFTEAEEDGLTTFEGAGKCDTCHSPPEFTNHTSRDVRAGKPADPQKGFIAANAFERMNMAERKAFYDTGIYNISVARTKDDIGRGGTAPNEPDLHDLNSNALPLSFSKLAILKAVGVLPDTVERFTPGLSKDAREDLLSDPEETRTAVDGAFKTPSLRNVELTGPYFHNGGAATLKQVVEFYTRGGNFPKANIADLDPEIDEIGRLRGDEEKQNNLVAFLLTLTDERVKFERAPFDHPQLFVPSGSGVNENEGQPSAGNENFIHIPAVGAKGRSEPLTTFLALPPTDPGFVTRTP